MAYTRHHALLSTSTVQDFEGEMIKAYLFMDIYLAGLYARLH
jgi:hypothetical protein